MLMTFVALNKPVSLLLLLRMILSTMIGCAPRTKITEALLVPAVGGGASEIQKNIISRRKLGLPKNF